MSFMTLVSKWGGGMRGRDGATPRPTPLTLAKGARQLVVHEALDTMVSLEGSYFSLFTPITYMGASPEGAVMMTRLAPPTMWAAA